MKQIIRFRWLIAAFWVIAAAGLFIFSPNLQELVADKGQISVPEGSPSDEAQDLIDQMSKDSGKNNASSVLVFHDENKLDKADKDEIQQVIKNLKEKKDELGISNLLNFNESKEIKEQTVSEDNQTILVPFDISLENKDIDQAREKIYDIADDTSIDHYVTGQQYIEQDIVKNSQEGLKRTEIITVGLILIILFIVFKSFVAPFIPLLTVGISYLAAQGIVAILADTVNFPLSTFTQIFMVAVMFGIGTDYCILLISRFKEEMAEHESTKDAVIATYKSGGKTIFFAGLAVLIGFSTIGLSTFSLYQSAVAVAVGVAIVLLALSTLVPFFLVVLGKKLFWPFDKNAAHKESKLWGTAGAFAWKRPIIALIIVAVITVPAMLTYSGDKSYNSLEEIGDSYDSVKGFNLIADSFGPGQTMPATVVFKTDKPVDSQQDYQDIAKITQRIAEMDGVKQVRSATRPTGEVIDDFLLINQTEKLADGIGESKEGLQDIQDGLNEASKELDKSQPQLQEAENGVDDLMQGTQDTKDGISQMQTALTDIQNGIESGAQGAGEIQKNLQTIQGNLNQTVSGNKELVQGYQQLAKQLQNIPGAAPLASSMNQLNSNLQQTVTAQEQLTGGINRLSGAVGELQSGLNKAGNGQQQVVGKIPEVQEGLSQIYGGQKELKQAFADMQSQLKELSSGLQDSVDGLKQVNEGLTGVEDFLKDFSENGNEDYVFIPQDTLNDESFQEGTEAYLSEDKKITKFEVILSDNPYSTKAMNQVEDINNTVDSARKETMFADSDQKIGGVSSTNNDLQHISNEDYTRTAILMIAGIFIILVIMLRSLVMPLYLIGSLIITYITSMAFSEFIFVHIFNYSGLTWAIPFFAFVMLVALGIDYSIFLMARFNEYKNGDIKEALFAAMRNMGTVIISAAVILGGTFGAMLPSGVLSLLQIATAVIAGLFLYAFVMLPLFIPLMVRMFGKANWWPFKR
ncbi:MMPL family transporter [Virgibacillus halodenitrificans]|uniref:MMPL family transporter n=1 Tax=Virgibacillus halodenitrificans TaxID=1482 RepID=UPI001FB32A44|nr:MMPL family transporter [Virgibacillus halodenitrificans]MCJ0929835.1 MMPL family transporter [Virgibacillus halodenitrificans]